MIINVYIRDRTIRTSDKGDKHFYTEHGRAWERIASIKDSSNYSTVIDKLKKQYNVENVFEDVVLKKKLGWKYYTDEQKARMVAAVKRVNTGRKMSNETKEKMSRAKRGRPSNAKGSKKSAFSKSLVAVARMGKSTVNGLRWCHHPDSGQEGRKRELPTGWAWGRSPEMKDYFKRY
jgi:NUMOD3 motif